ncbi:hypothetical protein ATANTOWER_001525 [Ataeniobius toweri]|uniref:Uncharacterized protein n=1 Tax=Ataeniobius toweri TaxID=208326 RepID=A0ABU7A3R4_9TELE|nr:hypothetical protein [Ataeniobius toweri]
MKHTSSSRSRYQVTRLNCNWTSSAAPLHPASLSPVSFLPLSTSPHRDSCLRVHASSLNAQRRRQRTGAGSVSLPLFRLDIFSAWFVLQRRQKLLLLLLLLLLLGLQCGTVRARGGLRDANGCVWSVEDTGEKTGETSHHQRIITVPPSDG